MTRHRFDPFSLLFGIVFAVTALALLTSHHPWSADQWRIIWPIGVVALGLAVLASAVRRGTPPKGGPAQG